MHTQPALLLGVLALAGEVLSVTFGAEGVHQQHGRQGRMNRRRGPGGTDSDGNPCKRGSDSSSSSSSSNSWKASSDIAKLSTGNVTVISATNDNEERSTTRQPLGSFDDLSSGRVSLEASTDQSDASSSSSSSSSADSWDSSSSDTWSSSSSWSSSDAAAAQPSGSGTSNGNGLSQVQSWSGNDVSVVPSSSIQESTPNTPMLLIIVRIMGLLHLQRSNAWQCELCLPLGCSISKFSRTPRWHVQDVRLDWQPRQW